MTPRVLSEARGYLNCQSLEGLETSTLRLGGSTMFLADRIYGSEITAAAAGPTRLELVSNITLAFFYDSGWYLPNWSLASFPRYTRNQQCPVSTFQCPTTASADPATIPFPYCKYNGVVAGSKRCSRDRQIVVTCPSTPGAFDDGCSVLGPQDEAFVCGIPSVQLDGPARQRRITYEGQHGFSYGHDSICIENTLSARRLSDGVPLTFASEGAGCFRARCSTTVTSGVAKTNVEVFITDTSDREKGGGWFPCPNSGPTITTDLRDAGYTSKFLSAKFVS